MGAVGYLYRKTMVNRIKIALRKPVTYFYVALFLFYVLFLPFSLRMFAAQLGGDSPEGMVTVLTVMAFWMIPGNLIAYAKRKGLVYRNSDVHFLFPSPVSPKRVLLYAHLKTLVAQVLMNVFAAVCGGVVFGVSLWRLAVYFVFSLVVENLLEGIEVRLNMDYLKGREECDDLADKVIYTGPIDQFYGYRLGALEYRSVRFETEVLDIPNFQGNAAVNYTDRETPWTRIIEHKWFVFGRDKEGKEFPGTVISREYSSEWKPGDEPYYPVNDEKNSALYEAYRKLADGEKKVFFGGRLGEYKYYDMDAVIAAALEFCDRELS